MFYTLHSGLANQEMNSAHSLLPCFLLFAKDYFSYKNGSLPMWLNQEDKWRAGDLDKIIGSGSHLDLVNTRELAKPREPLKVCKALRESWRKSSIPIY